MNGTILADPQNKPSDGTENQKQILNNSSKKQIVEIHKLPEIEEMKMGNRSSDTSKENLNELISSNRITNSLMKVPEVKRIWKGLNIFSAADCILLRPINPPDVTIGVSKNHVAQMVHNSIEVWDKTGRPLMKQSLYDFFNISRNHYITDPMMLYDNTSGNWFATIVDGGENRVENGLSYWSCKPLCKVILAKSNNDNPMKNLTLVEINSTQSDFFPDEPKISVNKFNLFMTTTEFNITDPEKNIFVAYLIDKGLESFFENSDNRILPLQWPNQHFAVPDSFPSDCTTTVALVKDDPTEMYSNSSSIQVLDYCNSEYAGSPIGPMEVKLPEVSKIVPARNLEDLITETDLKISSAIRDNQSVWIAVQAACQPQEISSNSCVRVLKIENTTTQGNESYSLAEDMNFHTNKTDLYYPTLAISKDKNLFLMTGFSNSWTFPSLSISQIVSKNETLDLYTVFGSYINNSTRYGDYFGSAIDPVDGSVWLSGQYVDQSISIPVPRVFANIESIRERTWSTIIANVS